MTRKAPPSRLVLPGAVAALTAGAGAAAIAGAVAVRHSHDKSPRLYGGAGALRDSVLPHCPLLKKPYHPTFWASSRHMQTVLGLARAPFCPGTYRRQQIMSNDGGTLALDWFNACDDAKFGPAETPVFLVMHGINGGSHEGYCKWACYTAHKRGWRAVVLNYRGCNGLPLTSPRGYNATVTADIHVAVVSIKGRFPSAPLFGVGYSLGGVILTKYLAEADLGLHGHHEGPPCPSTSGFAAAAVVSSPVCLWRSSNNINVPWSFSYIYNLALAFKLREYMATHRPEIESGTRIDVATALTKMTVKEIEDMGAPLTFGYGSRQEYYENANGLSYLPHIKTPTLVLLAEDDPFLGVLPDLECEANRHTLLAVTDKGGHVAFLQNAWPFGTAWMDEVVTEFMEATLKHYPYAADAEVFAAAAAQTAAAYAASMQPTSHGPSAIPATASNANHSCSTSSAPESASERTLDRIHKATLDVSGDWSKGADAASMSKAGLSWEGSGPPIAGQPQLQGTWLASKL